MLNVGLPVLLSLAAIGTWLFLPRIALAPTRSRYVLDVATHSFFVSYAEGLSGGPGRLLSAGTVWDASSGKSIAEGLSAYGIISPDGQKVMNTAAVLDLRTKRTVALENPSFPIPSLVPRSSFISMRFSNHGNLIAVIRNGWLYLLDAETGKVLHVLNNQMASSNCGLLSTSFSPDDKVLAAGDARGNVTLWNIADGELTKTLSSEASVPCDALDHPAAPWLEVWSVAFAPDGERLASYDKAGLVRIWEVKTQRLLRTQALQFGRGTVRFTPDGQFLLITEWVPFAGNASGSQQRHTAIMVVKARAGELAETIDVPGFAGLGFSGKNAILVAAVLNGRLKVDQWLLPREIRIPFTSPHQQPPLPSDAELATAYEEHAISHLQQLQLELAKYRNGEGHNGFPTSLQALDAAARIDDLPIIEQIHGYRYSYHPEAADAEGKIPAYSLSASPLAYRQTGTTSFLVNETGAVRATTEGREAVMSDPVVRTLQEAAQVAATVSPGLPTTAESPAPAATQASTQVAQRRQQSEAADQWAAQAEAWFQRGNYREALQNCEAALRIDPGNARAVQLKAKIDETMRILGKN
jgi:hypothetical protein